MFVFAAVPLGDDFRGNHRESSKNVGQTTHFLKEIYILTIPPPPIPLLYQLHTIPWLIHCSWSAQVLSWSRPRNQVKSLATVPSTFSPAVERTIHHLTLEVTLQWLVSHWQMSSHLHLFFSLTANFSLSEYTGFGESSQFYSSTRYLFGHWLIFHSPSSTRIWFCSQVFSFIWER